jgi:hypothetical protein
MKATRILFVLFSLILIIGCSPQKRLARLIDRHPELVRTDTMTFMDTVRTRTVEIDTIIMWSQLNRTDTITLIKERLTVRLIKKTDTLELQGEYLGDTIYIEKQIPVEKVVFTPSSKNDFKHESFLIGFVLGGFLVLFFMMLLSFKFK